MRETDRKNIKELVYSISDMAMVFGSVGPRTSNEIIEMVTGAG